ncbi:MAG: radical SAM protein [Candidatus Peribacteria bacterium]|nr:radical SAM protein [Candidatus Peribacteria bacterium]
MNVAITGCGTLDKGKLLAETEFFAIYPELLPYQSKIKLLGEAPQLTDAPSSTEKEPSIKSSLYTKHFLMIQNGCDNHCSFCLTVLKRGKHQSRPLTDIITEIQQIEAQGGKEIVLTGVNLMARGASTTRNPTESKFPALLETILQQTHIPRIRISSI